MESSRPTFTAYKFAILMIDFKFRSLKKFEAEPLQAF